MDDKQVIAIVVAEVVRRQPPDASTDHLVQVAAQTVERAETALRLWREAKPRVK